MKTLIVWLLVFSYPEYDETWTPYPNGYSYEKEETCRNMAKLLNQRAENMKHFAVYDCLPFDVPDKKKYDL